MKEKISEYKKLLSNKQFLISAITALVFLGVALVINFYAGMYATEKASSSVTDVILSNTRAYDLDGVFVYGTFLMTFFIVFVGIYRPKRIPFVFRQYDSSRTVPNTNSHSFGPFVQAEFRRRFVFLRSHRHAVSGGSDFLGK
jgi:hypothetical protein